MKKRYQEIGGKCGRHAKPAQIKMLEGNPGHRRINELALTVPMIEDAQCSPDWPKSAQASFLKLKRAAEATRTLNKNNIGAFSTLCLLDAVVDEAARLAKIVGSDKGPEWLITKYGAFLGASPTVKLIWDAARNAKPYYDAFGMTPSSVQGIVKGAMDDKSDFDKI